MQATSSVALNKMPDPNTISKADLATCEFLIQVYLIDAAELFSTLKLSYANVMEHAVKALTKNINQDKSGASSSIGDAVRSQFEMLEIIKGIRKKLVDAVRAIEGI